MTRVTKVPAAMEDLDCGIGKTTQSRAGQAVEVTLIDQHFAVESLDDIRKVDIGKYTYAKLGELAYRFDPNATSGIPSDFGPGYWNISYLPASGVQLSDQRTAQAAIDALEADFASIADSVGTNLKVFSAKLVKNAVDGWVLEEANKVSSVQEVTYPGFVDVSSLRLVVDGKFKTLNMLGEGFVQQTKQLDNNTFDLVLGRKLRGTLDLSTGALSNVPSYWGATVNSSYDPVTGEIVLNHPSNNTVLGSFTGWSYRAKTVTSITKRPTMHLVAVTEGADTKTFTPLAGFSAVVAYNTADDSVYVQTDNIGITADKGQPGEFVVTHPEIRENILSEAADDTLIAKRGVSSTSISIVKFFNFSGVQKTDYDSTSQVYLASSALLPTKVSTSSRVDFDCGWVPFPMDAFPVGTTIYISGLLEVDNA